MEAIFYLYKRTLVNRIRKALKKPMTYIWLVLFGGYFIFVVSMFGRLVKEMETPPAYTLTAFLTMFAFIFMPSNLIAYSRRKGLLFRPSDVHFLFPAPMGPKKVLLYAHLRTIITGIFLSLLVTGAGIFWFGISVFKMLCYFLFSCVLENILEASMMTLCYGTERFGRKQMRYVQAAMYLLIGVFILVGVVMCVERGLSFDTVLTYLHSPVIQMVPVIGWCIAAIHLIFMGPTAVSVTGTALFLLATTLLTLAALRIRCVGEYYEDAMQFADDYEEARARGKKGEIASVGKKKKYGKAQVTYRGSCARALFYRQLLEYKKNRFFIFGFHTLMSLGAGIVLGGLAYQGELDAYGPFIILGVMAYITFIFSGYLGKWGKELEKPYTYLLPDSSFHKLWYSTLIEHIRAAVDGCLIAVPAGIILRMSVLRILLIVAIYVCLQACKLYASVMVEAFLGNTLGTVGKQYMRLLIEGMAITVGIIGAAAGTILVSLEAGFILLILLSAVLTGGMMAVAAVNFDKMESL